MPEPVETDVRSERVVRGIREYKSTVDRDGIHAVRTSVKPIPAGWLPAYLANQ